MQHVLRPFRDCLSSYETGKSVGEENTGDPIENHIAQPQAEFVLHVSHAGLEPVPDSAV